MALAAGTGYLVNLIYYVSTGTLKMVGEIPVPSPMALTSPLGCSVLILMLSVTETMLNHF